MKKFLLIALCALMCLGALTGCGGAKDWAYIEEKGEMVIGITLFEPMNYYDENGKLIGFETEFAEAVCAKLGVSPKFQVIDWEQKENELKSRTIDAIWNGLTVTEERKENMAFSTAYVSNKQVVIAKKANAEKYATIEGMAGASITAENGSAGETAIKANATLSQNSYVASAAQKDVLLEVKAGTSELGGDLESNAMFAGFIDDDRYPLAFVCVVEGGGAGARTCVPVLNQVLRASMAVLNAE